MMNRMNFWVGISDKLKMIKLHEHGQLNVSFRTIFSISLFITTPKLHCSYVKSLSLKLPKILQVNNDKVNQISNNSTLGYVSLR